MLVRTLLALSPEPLARRVEGLLDSRDLSIFTAAGPDEVWRVLQREDIDLLVASDMMVASSPETWTASIRTLPEAPELVILAEREDPSRRAALLAAGCLAVLNVRISDRELRSTLQTLVGRLAQDAAARLTAQRIVRPHGFEEVVSVSPAMADVITVARQVAGADSSLLILGETGVGKERLARSIHFESSRAAGPFVPVNCGAIPEGLLESELFGHEQGAFTGAVRARRGHFEVAHRGTLFLDEIGELPLHLQVKLLRVLEDRHVQRLGSERPERVDVRIIAATNRQLEEEVEARRFRADLFYRLAVVTLTIPPLRERREDIPVLVAAYLAQFRRTLGKAVEGIDDDALAALTRHTWPGNVRELINVLERSVLLAQGPRIALRDLPRSISGAPRRDAGRREPPVLDLTPADLDLPIPDARRRAISAFDRAYLSRLLRRTGGRVGETARLAGISERSLYDLMRRSGLRKEDFRTPRPVTSEAPPPNRREGSGPAGAR
jgi:two-component system response regulator AtoC